MHALLRRTAITSAALALVLVTSPSTAAAQAVGIFGAAEADDDDVTFFMLGASLSAGGLGWKPYVSVTAYNLRFPTGATGTLTRNVVLPSVGLRNVSATQSVSFGVGYAFADADADEPLIVPAESGEGVVGSAQWNHWGTGNRALQLIGSYNFGTEFLWTRGRATWRLAPESPLWVGGEASLFGGGSSSIWLAQFGPLVEWRFNPQFRLAGSAGLKAGVSNAEGSSVYGRIEFLWLPNAR